MNALKPILLAAVLALGSGVQAQTSATPDQFTEGEVRKVDKEQKKITLKHGAIKNLDMPPMSMVFQVNDAAAFDKFKAGDKVRFKAVSDAGKFVVVDIQATP